MGKINEDNLNQFVDKLFDRVGKYLSNNMGVNGEEVCENWRSEITYELEYIFVKGQRLFPKDPLAHEVYRPFYPCFDNAGLLIGGESWNPELPAKDKQNVMNIIKDLLKEWGYNE